MNISGKSWAGCKSALAALLAMSMIGLPAVADDTELYFGKPSSTKPAPLVMLTLDYRPNLGSTYCSDFATTCKTAFSYGTDAIGTQIYNALDVTSGAVTLFDAFRAVFKVLFFSTTAADGMSIGFMMNHDDCNVASCGGESNGGYVLRGFKVFQAGDGNGAKQQLLDIMKAIPVAHGNVSHPYQGKELFFELYRYLTGQDVLNGHKGYTDYSSNDTDRNLDNELVGGGACTPANVTTIGGLTEAQREALPSGTAVGTGLSAAAQTTLSNNCLNRNKTGSTYYRISSLLAWDKTIESGTHYISPYSSGDWSCSGTYSINLLFQVSSQEDDSDTAITKSLANQGLSDWGLKNKASFTNMIAALHNNDIAGGQAAGVPNVAGNQTLTSYFLSNKAPADPAKNGGKVSDYASAGGTTAISALDDPFALYNALIGVLADINAVSSSYVAVTVPVNADNRVTSLPNLFLALFQVDENGKPYWPGNVKKLDIVTSTDETTGIKTLAVKDAGGRLAFNEATGHIKDDALTLWTVPTAPDVDVPTDRTKGIVNQRDGSSVRRGGAGHKIPAYIAGTGVGETNATGTRQIFLEPATVTGTAAAGNPMMGLDASSGSTLLGDVTIQDLLGIHDTSGTGTCPGRDLDNYCVTFIDQVLAAAGQPTTGTAAAKAPVATRLFLRWVRGFDVFNEAGVKSTWDGLSPTVPQRKWLMGDVLHSRPLAVNYGARGGYGTDNQDVRLIFGANDGLLRMVRNTAFGTSKPSAATQQGDDYGEEVWAFMPRELLAHVPALAMTTGNVGLNRPYGADGPPTLFSIDTNSDGIIDNDGSCTVGADDCDRAWVYFGLRRGGKSYYALDISNPDATTPNLLWKVNETTTGFTELGLTFSSPRVGWVRFEDVSGLNLFGTPSANVPVPVVIFGGGYHGHAVTGGASVDHHDSVLGGGPSKDTILGTPFTGNDTQGNAIYIVHARTGQLLWKATLGSGSASATNFQAPEMKHGIAAPVSPMDADGDGILDRLYVADTGGRVWRVDIPEFVPGVSTASHRRDTWKATVLADLRPSDAALALSTDNDLRFFHGATLVRRARDGIGVYDAVYLGSGDREHPQSETNKHNWFFLLKDRLTTSGDTAVASRTPYVPTDLLDVTNACFAGSSSPTCSDSDLSKGWRLALEETGEKNLSEPFIGGEGVIFTTYLPQGVGPDDAKCVPLGASRLYQVSLDTGAPLRFLRDVAGDTFSKTDRWINLYSGIDGGVVAVSPDFWITSTGKSRKNPPQKPIQFYWRESGVDTVK